jgi:dihydrofolate synthase/folylpolyglutamate synthase
VEITDQALKKGLSSVEWPCRMEVLKRRPLLIADGAHNPYSAARLREAVKEYVHARKTFLVFGASGGKHYDEMAAELAPICSQVLTTRSRHPRSVSSSEAADVFRRLGIPTVETNDVRDAVAQALEMAGEDDLVLVTGSLFVAAEAREYVKGIKGEVYPEMQSSLLVP